MYSKVFVTNARSCSAFLRGRNVGGDGVGCLPRPLRDDNIAQIQRPVLQPDLLALTDLLEHIPADVVDQRDAGFNQQLRSQVRVPAADTRHSVHHGRHLAPDQRIRADPVQVIVIDDGNVAGLQALGQVLGAPVEASRRRYPA